MSNDTRHTDAAAPAQQQTEAQASTTEYNAIRESAEDLSEQRALPPQDAAPSEAVTTAETPPRKKWLTRSIMFSVPVLIIAGGIYLWMTSGTSVSTDNAYVQQDKVSVSSEVGGRIVEVAVHENQHVNAGDLLFRIDPAPYQIALSQAEADIAKAEANVTTLTVNADTLAADIQTARDAIRFAQSNLARERALMDRGFNTRERMDTAELRVTEARGRLEAAEAAQARARAELATSPIAPGVNPGLLAARAARDSALLNLSRTEVRAPASGTISQTTRLLPGQMMVSGLPAVTIVVSNRSWVEANFKETDLNHMRVGQHATVSIDAYGDLELAGHVESIGAGTGSEFSVLPAQNATGNWVKVTQRVPVRIAIDGRSPRPLIAGLSADVRVHFNDRK